MTETQRAIDEKYRAMLMALSPAERLAMACRMFSTARALAEAGIRQGQDPVEDSAPARRRIFLHFYRNDFAPGETDRILCRIADADE
jgi:hypothetical protein